MCVGGWLGRELTQHAVGSQGTGLRGGSERRVQAAAGALLHLGDVPPGELEPAGAQPAVPVQHGGCPPHAARLPPRGRRSAATTGNVF